MPKIDLLLLRSLYLIPGLILELFKVANIGARNLEMKWRYRHAIIDPGCCATSDTVIGKFSHIYENSIINHSSIGDYTYICRNALIQNTTIGNYCSISHDVICGLGNHPLNNFSTSPLFYKINNPLKIKVVNKNSDYQEYKPIEIGNDVWIGARVVVMDGVKIGHGAVIATGAVVTKDVPAFAIVGGVPAKLIRYRLSSEEQEKMTESRWWEKDAHEVCKIFSEINES